MSRHQSIYNKTYIQQSPTIVLSLAILLLLVKNRFCQWLIPPCEIYMYVCIQNIHTHTHTYTHTHTVDIHTYTQTCTQTHTCTDTDTHRHRHRHRHTQTQTQTHRHTQGHRGQVNFNFLWDLIFQRVQYFGSKFTAQQCSYIHVLHNIASYV